MTRVVSYSPGRNNQPHHAILKISMYVHPSRANNATLPTTKATKRPSEARESNDRNYIIGFIIGFILLLWTAIMAHSHSLTGLQARIFYDFDNLDLAGGFTTAAKWITEGLGAAYPIAACALIAILFKRFRLAWRFLFTAGGTAAAFYVIKKTINEPRPIIMLSGHLHQRVVETGPGFPSGHESTAAALALTLWLVLPKKWRWLSILWIVVVAMSRLYLGVHTPGDVLGGFALGLIAVCFVQLIPSKLANRIYLYKGEELLEKGR
jgi:membrane-associated phospholipid phosphatase